MIKKQVGFQNTIFDIPEQYEAYRELVQNMQKSGWEVIATETLVVAKDQDTGRDVERLSVTLVKYEWVDEESVAPPIVAKAKKAGRPKKAEK